MIKNIFGGKMVVFLAIIISITAFSFSFATNNILTYNDAASHLNIARRVIDNLTPGLAQIGTVWLPLPHVLMLPFAWNDFLWHTGIAGSIVSMTAYVVSVFFIFKTVLLITKSKVAAFMGAGVLALNPNILYLQTTPMTEPLLVATFSAAIYFLARYITDYEVKSLLFLSVAVMGSTLIRYDGWFLFASLLVLLPLWMLFIKGKGAAEGAFLLFAFMGGFGIFSWILWNWAIFKDPMYFITGPYSAYAQQRVLKHVGQLPTDGNLFNAAYYYLWSMIDNTGLFIFISGFVGVVTVPFIVKKFKYLIVYIAAFSPILFNVIALYLGQSAMNVPEAPSNPGMFNIRYGLMALPFLALVLGTISKIKVIAIIVFVVFLFQMSLFLKAGIPVSLADGQHGLANTYYTVEASAWLKSHYNGGLILASLASHDAFVARAQIPMVNYVHEGTREYWREALQDPGENIKYVAMLSFPPDIVYKSIANNGDFKKNYRLVHTYKTFEIYERIK